MKAPIETLGDLCDILFTMGEEKGKIDALLKEKVADINAVELRVIDAMKAQKTTIARGQRATVGLGEREVVGLVDWDKFRLYVLRHKHLELLQRRVAKGAYDELVANGAKIPGVVVNKFPTLSVRKIQE
jgi:hypothetical protein